MDHRSPSSRMTRRSRLILFLLWLCAVLIGFLIISGVAKEEVNRTAAGWEQRLDLVAAGQSRAISAWMAQRRDALASLSENVSLKLYLTQLSLAPASAEGEEPAEVTFLRNLVLSTAANNGFGSIEEPAIRANVPASPGAGVRLLGAGGAALVNTRNMPPAEMLPPSLNNGNLNQPVMAGPFQIGSDVLAVAFRQPIVSVQGEAGEAPIAQLIGSAVLDDRFFKLLEPPVSETPTSQSLLISSQNGRDVAYASKAAGKNANGDDVKNAIAHAGQMVEGKDGEGRPVFAVAEAVENVPGWYVLRKVDRQAALADAVSRARWWCLSYLLATALLTAAVIAFWRNQSAVRAKEAARHYRALALRIEQQEQMLTLIAETTPVATYILDEEERFRYANKRAAEQFQMERSSLSGKTLSSVIGTARAGVIARINREAIDAGEPRRSEEEEGETANLRSIAREHIPLEAIPLSGDEHHVPGVLVLESDVTPLVQARERERRVLSKLIRTLVSLVDARDPHAAHHSTCVSLVAHAVAETMHLPAPLPETARVAGQLLNLGKILVPETVLNSSGKDDATRDTIRHAIQASADLLEEVPFEGPVTETVRQSQEAFDGSGPMGLKGEDILITARIVTVANAFVALISPRAWRQGNSIDQALKTMLESIGSQYDRAAVAALVTYVESGRGALELRRCTEGLEEPVA